MLTPRGAWNRGRRCGGFERGKRSFLFPFYDLREIIVPSGLGVVLDALGHRLNEGCDAVLQRRRELAVEQGLEPRIGSRLQFLALCRAKTPL